MLIADLFTAAGEVMTGLVTLSGTFVTGLWAHPLGQVFIVSGLISVAVGLAYKIFFRKRYI